MSSAISKSSVEDQPTNSSTTSDSTSTSPTASKLRTHLSTYPIIAKPYHLVDSITPFHLPSRIIDRLPAVPTSLDAAADQYLTQFDGAYEAGVTRPVQRGYNTVIVKPREVVRTGVEAYWGKGMEVVAGSVRMIEDKVEIVGEYFLPDTTETSQETQTHEKKSTNGIKPISYKDALVSDESSLPDPGEEEAGGGGAEWTEGGQATNPAASYKTALVEGASGPQDAHADEPGGSGADWPQQEHPPLPKAHKTPNKETTKDSSKEETSISSRSSSDYSFSTERQKPTNPRAELMNLTSILQIYATRAYERNAHKSTPQLVHDAFGLTKFEFMKMKELVDQQWTHERGYVNKMLEAGKKVEKQGKSEGRRMSGGQGGVLGFAKGAVGFGVGVVSGGVGVITGVVGKK